MELQPPKRYIYLILSAGSLAYIYFSLLLLFKNSSPFFSNATFSWYANVLNLLFFQFVFIYLAWIGAEIVGGVVSVLLSCALTIFLSIVLHDPHFLLFLLYYPALLIHLYIYDKIRSGETIVAELDSEKLKEQQNSLSLDLHEKTNTLSAFFEKYSNYFNLREIAQDFSTSLSIDRICELTIDKVFTLIQRGEGYLLYLTDLKENALSLTASKWSDPKHKVLEKKGDICDLWVLKNKQHLIVTDVTKDFRFDLTNQPLDSARSVVIAPIVDDARTIGLLRIQSSLKEAFTVDDLRLLDIVAQLAASAISNAQLYQQTSELAIHDSLTKLYVHRHFKHRLKEEQQRALFTNTSLSLLMCDIDFFKKYNDRYGHAAGDLILIQIAEMIRSCVAETAIVARYGGEEFAVILPQTSLEEARQAAEQIRQKVDKQAFMLRQESTHITISIGVSNLPKDTSDDEELIRIADQRLYEAKKTGRNKVC